MNSCLRRRKSYRHLEAYPYRLIASPAFIGQLLAGTGAESPHDLSIPQRDFGTG
ncbi:MAG: hypothetical protein ACI350_09595 [Prevotella sp.]